jgi:membrane protein implicated in regulation of membrane protease activity
MEDIVIRQAGLIWVLSALGVAVVIWWLAERSIRRSAAAREAQSRHAAAALIGQSHELDQAIAGGQGEIRIAGTLWSISGPDLAAGSRVTVTGIEGVKLVVTPERKLNLPKSGSFFA